MAKTSAKVTTNGLPRMVVVHNDPADDVRMLMDQIGGSETIPGESLMAKCVYLLEHYGQLTEQGYTLNANVGPLAWRALVAMMRVFDSGDQWTYGDLALDGLKFANVQAVDAVGDVALPDEEDAYDPSQVEAVPFSYDQALAVSGHSRQTIYNWRSCCKKFPRDPESPLYRGKPEWRGALFSAFYELRVDALPIEFVDLWLRKAAQPVAEGGASVDDIRTAKKKLLAAMRGDLEEAGGDAEIEEKGGTKKYITLGAAQRKWGNVLALYLQATVADLGDVAATLCAESALRWIYSEADPALLESAQKWAGQDDDEEEGQ